MSRNTHIVNPLAEAMVHRVDGEAVHIDVSAFSNVRGFTKTRLRKGRSAGFDSALRLLAGGSAGDPVPAGLSAAEAASLWQAGLIIVPQERAAAFIPDGFAIAADEFDRLGYTLLPACLTRVALTALQAHYCRLIDWGTVKRGDDHTDRYTAHNDAAGRVLSHALRGSIERAVGRPIKASYSDATLYVGGTAVPEHTDRPQCEYTTAVQVDYRPLHHPERSPWPLQLFLSRDASAKEYLLPIGGGVFFHGREIPHARPPLPASAQCWMVFLHYVNADFCEELD
jgi:hypothetical protein